MGFNFDSFLKGLMCQKDAVPRIHWPAGPNASALQNKTKLEQPQGPPLKKKKIYIYPSIISIDRKGLIATADGWKVNLYSAQLDCRWMGNEPKCYNRPMRVKLFYHAKESGWEIPGRITLLCCFQLIKKEKYLHYLVKLTYYLFFNTYFFFFVEQSSKANVVTVEESKWIVNKDWVSVAV